MLKNAILFRLFQSALGEGIKTLKVKDRGVGARIKLLHSSFYFHLSRVTSSVERKFPYSLTTYILLQRIMKQRTGSKMIPLILMATVAAVLLTLFGQQALPSKKLQKANQPKKWK